MILACLVRKFKIWSVFTVSDIYIAQIKICAINQLEKEKLKENYFEQWSNISRVWSPSIFDNDEVSQVYGERSEISSRWTEVTFTTILIGKSQRNGNDNIFIDGRN